MALASGLGVRSMPGSSEAVVGAALWEGPAITHTHPSQWTRPNPPHILLRAARYRNTANIRKSTFRRNLRPVPMDIKMVLVPSAGNGEPIVEGGLSFPILLACLSLSNNICNFGSFSEVKMSLGTQSSKSWQWSQKIYTRRDQTVAREPYAALLNR
jgi:hypothetical protein